MRLRIERRMGINVLVYHDGSCRPANDAEVTLWRALQRAKKAMKR